MQKVRLDLLLVEHGLAGARTKAQALIMAGQARVDGQVENLPEPVSLVTIALSEPIKKFDLQDIIRQVHICKTW